MKKENVKMYFRCKSNDYLKIRFKLRCDDNVSQFQRRRAKSGIPFEKFGIEIKNVDLINKKTAERFFLSAVFIKVVYFLLYGNFLLACFIKSLTKAAGLLNEPFAL